MQYNLNERIKSGLIFLLLGQNCFYKENPLLQVISSEYQLGSVGKSHDLYLEIENIDSISWIKNQADLILVPDSLKIISRLPWNGIITSEVDGIIERVFRNNWREVSAIYDSDKKIVGSLTERNRLKISCLFGTVNSELEGAHLPLTPLEFYKAKSNAVRMLSKYTQDVITPFGTVIIDGYDHKDDWLDLETLLPFVASCKAGQVHYFGGSISKDNPLWKSLVDKKIITEYEQTFAEYLANEEDDGNIDIEELIADKENAKRITVNKKSYSIPKDIYNAISKNAIILDDSILVLDELPEDAEEDFRHFLYESGNQPVWEGYKWGFYFWRSLEKELNEEIQCQLKKDFNTNPVILSGQAGSGKSVLLGNIAYQMKMECKLPVIYIPQFIRIVSYATILDFCQWIEISCKAERLIIIWDSSCYNDEISKYIELNNYLTSAGRKVLIIGSSLKLSEKVKNEYIFENVEMNTAIDERERQSICSIFNKFSGEHIDESKIESIGESNIFVACYRLLPPSRLRLRKGIIDEAKKNRATLQEALHIEIDEENVFTCALMKAGVYISKNKDKESVNIEKLVDYVCVPAQFGITIPFNLILRCFNNQYSINIAEKLDEIDFFRFIEGIDGEWEISVRNSLEAEIVAKSELSSIEKQVDIIIKMIEEIKDLDDYISHNSEMDFLIDLLKAVGPNGLKSEEYSSFYLKIADTLGKIREEGIWDSRTILQESLLLREYAKNLDDQVEKSPIILLAKDLVKDEIERLKKQRGNNRPHIGRLYCELGANIGSQIIECLWGEHTDKADILEKYQDLIEILQNARNNLPDSFYPLDICAWASLGILQQDNIQKKIKAEVYAENMSFFEQAELTYPDFCDIPEYSARLLQINDSFGNKDLSESLFNKLNEMDSGTGIYVRAKNMLRGVNLNAKLNTKEIKLCKEVLEYIEGYKEIAYKDEKCIYLVFKLKWLVFTGYPVLYAEKQTVGLEKSQWLEILDIIELILQLTPDRPNAVQKYIKAIALFNTGRKQEYLAAFKELSHVHYPFSRRIIMSYVASNEKGETKTFTGSVVSFSGEKKAVFHINELNIEIPYFNTNFVREVTALGGNYQKIEIGFNFLGIQVSKVNISGGR